MESTTFGAEFLGGIDESAYGCVCADNGYYRFIDSLPGGTAIYIDGLYTDTV